MIAGVRIEVARLALEGVEDPILKLGVDEAVAVPVKAATLEQVDHHFVDIIDIAAEFEGVAALDPAEDIRTLNAMLVRFGDAGQRVGHAEGEHADRNRRPSIVGASRL